MSSQYADGLFTQHPNSSGQVYNVSKELSLVLHIQLLYKKKGATQSSLVPRPGGSGLGMRLPPSHEGNILLLQLFPGNVDKLQSVEERLLETVAQLKTRLDWLNSGR